MLETIGLASTTAQYHAVASAAVIVLALLLPRRRGLQLIWLALVGCAVAVLRVPLVATLSMNFELWMLLPFAQALVVLAVFIMHQGAPWKST